jgi:hypothetical protein
MNRNWHRLDLSIESALLPEFTVFATGAEAAPYPFSPQEVLDSQWCDWVKSRYGIEFYAVLLTIHDQEHLDTLAYIDNPAMNLSAAVNFSIFEDHRPIQWFHATDQPGMETPVKYYQEIQYRAWPIEHLTLEEELILGNQATLVRLDVPHCVAPGPGRRSTVSLRFRPWDLSWAGAVELFKPWIL